MCVFRRSVGKSEFDLNMTRITSTPDESHVILYIYIYRYIYIFICNISLNSSYNGKFEKKVSIKTHFMFSFFSKTL